MKKSKQIFVVLHICTSSNVWDHLNLALSPVSLALSIEYWTRMSSYGFETSAGHFLAGNELQNCSSSGRSLLNLQGTG